MHTPTMSSLVLALTLAAALPAWASDNPFAAGAPSGLIQLAGQSGDKAQCDTGKPQPAGATAKCGEGKCGAMDAKPTGGKPADGKCDTGQDLKCGAGKCGAGMMEKGATTSPAPAPATPKP